jgi:4-amino-4-deoxychorismate lyase
MRSRSLALGLADERTLSPLPEPGDRWLLLNSLGARPLRAIDGTALDHLSAAEAEALWRQLL